MTATILDGNAFAAAMQVAIAAAAAGLRADHGLVPGLAVVLVGDDAASQVYVRAKTRRAHAAGFDPVDHRLPVSASQQQLADLVAGLNADPAVHGILVQLPLPGHLDPAQHAIPVVADQHVVAIIRHWYTADWWLPE